MRSRDECKCVCHVAGVGEVVHAVPCCDELVDAHGARYKDAETVDYEVVLMVGSEKRQFLAKLAKSDVEPMPEDARKDLACEAMLTEIGYELEAEHGDVFFVKVKRVDEEAFQERNVQCIITPDFRCI